MTNVLYGPLTLTPPADFVDETTVVFSRPIPTAQGKPVAGSHPLSVHLTYAPRGKVTDAKMYLQHKLKQMQSALRGYQLSFIEAGPVAGRPGVRAQFSFEQQFRLVQLLWVWIEGPYLLTATLSTTAGGVEEGWKVLTPFAESVGVRGEGAGPVRAAEEATLAERSAQGAAAWA